MRTQLSSALLLEEMSHVVYSDNSLGRALSSSGQNLLVESKVYFLNLGGNLDFSGNRFLTVRCFDVTILSL